MSKYVMLSSFKGNSMRLKMLTVEKLHAESLVAVGGAINTTACLNAIMWMNQKRL